MYNFTELKDNCAVILQRSDDANYKTKIGVWLNLSHDFLFNIYDYWGELQDEHNFTTVDGQEDYYMPTHFDKPLAVFDITNDTEIIPGTHEEYFRANISNVADATEGKPTSFRLYGVYGVKRQVPTAGSIVRVKSSSSADTAGAIVRVEGYLDSALSIIGYENITVSTSTPTTNVLGTTTFYKIIHISKSADTTGYITLTDSSSNTLAEIAPNERVLFHRRMKLGLIPDASTYNIRVLFKRKKNKLISDYDYPFVDADDYMILNSVGYGLAEEKETYDKAVTMWKKAEEALGVILRNQQSKLGPAFQHKITSMWAQAHRV